MSKDLDSLSLQVNPKIVCLSSWVFFNSTSWILFKKTSQYMNNALRSGKYWRQKFHRLGTNGYMRPSFLKSWTFLPLSHLTFNSCSLGPSDFVFQLWREQWSYRISKGKDYCQPSNYLYIKLIFCFKLTPLIDKYCNSDKH